MVRFYRDERGMVTLLWSVALVAILGLMAVGYEVGRIGSTHSELQSYADSVALAAAGELDGRSDAITRATNAASALITDRQTFGTGGNDLSGASDYTLTFLTGLPASDSSATGSSTTNPARARFVRVDVTPVTINTPFAAVAARLRGSTRTSVQTAAYAVAGFTSIACDIASMMFCLPAGYDSDGAAGTIIQLRTKGGNGAWGPGNFGFLRARGNATVATNGACSSYSQGQQDWCVLAAKKNATQCFDANGVDTQPGQQVGRMAAAINTRFDIYEGVLKSQRGNPDFGPAPNVISGIEVYLQGGGPNPNCKQRTSSDTIAMPIDDCFNSGGCPGGRFGDGNFATGYADYLSTNYDSPPAWFPAYPTTRYDIYLAEIANQSGGVILPNRDETGTAICSASPSADPERRVIIAAGIDCNTHTINGQTNDVPVADWVRVFLVRPADTVTKDIFVEVLGSARGESGAGSVNDHIQLYR